MVLDRAFVAARDDQDRLDAAGDRLFDRVLNERFID